MHEESTSIDDLYDLKGCIRGGAHRTATHPGERCRHPRPSGSANTSMRGVTPNLFVERGVECGPAQLAPAALRVVSVDNPTGNSSKSIQHQPLHMELYTVPSHVHYSAYSTNART